MKNFLGVIFIILGIALAIKIGLFVLFIGGFLGIANAIDSHTITATLLITSFFKILFSGAVGYFILLIGIALGRECIGK